MNMKPQVPTKKSEGLHHATFDNNNEGKWEKNIYVALMRRGGKDWSAFHTPDTASAMGFHALNGSFECFSGWWNIQFDFPFNHFQ